MAMEMHRYSGDKDDENSSLTFMHSVANQKFYDRVWKKAIVETGVNLVRDWGVFTPQQIDDVLEELHTLINWCEQNLKGEDYIYMKYKLEVLPEESPKSNEPFYIF
ncbi:MAG: hypothetical protein NC177_00735 [Ruminococcus flavefaciens]|nr:hypothetical protein [Ruminococcus flavefaciens]